MDPLLARRLRTAPALEIVVADRLAPEELRALGGLRGEPDLFGLLRLRGDAVRGAVAARAIDGDTALLLFTLRDPGPLPETARRKLGREAPRAVARWIADGILEVEVEGEFRTGPEALARLASAPLASTPLSHRSSAPVAVFPRLTDAALASAAALDTADVERVAFHLYAFHRLPLDDAWHRRLPDAEAVLAALGLAPGGALHGTHAARWIESKRTERWLHWRSRRIAAPPSEAAVFKLYLSPMPAALLADFNPFLEALGASEAFEVKVGAGAAGLLRPDKLVAYFATFEQAAAAAQAAAASLKDLAAGSAHGVPLTAPIDAAGLLSWGIDPAAGDWGAPGGGDSWRLWLARLLAGALLAARVAGLDEEGACVFARQRAELEGIDGATWAPDGGLRRAMGVPA